jgi:hypothetical protein
MTEIHEQLALAAGEAARLARNVDASRLDDPTPCLEYDARDLAAHSMQESDLLNFMQQHVVPTAPVTHAAARADGSRAGTCVALRDQEWRVRWSPSVTLGAGWSTC